MRTDTSVAVTFVDDVLPEVLNEGTVVQTGTVHYGQLAFPQVKAVSKVLVQLNVQTRVQVFKKKMTRNDVMVICV